MTTQELGGAVREVFEVVWVEARAKPDQLDGEPVDRAVGMVELLQYLDRQ